MRNLRIFVVATLLSAAPSSAFAICRVVPGPEGELSTWLVLGPFRTPNPRPSRTVDAQLSVRLREADPSTLTPSASERWTPAASASALFDAGAALRGQGPRTAFFGATLVTSSAVRVQLFSGADDGLAIFLDGREISRRGAVRAAREDDDRVELNLTPGRHRLVLRSYVHGGEQRAFVRLVGDDFRPTSAVRVLLDGVDDRSCDALAASATKLRVERSAQDDGTRIEAFVSYPGGTAAREDEQSRALRVDGTSATSATASLPLDGAFAGSMSAWVVLAQDRDPVRVRVGSVDRAFDASIDPAVRRALLSWRAATSALDERAPPPWLPLGSLWSVVHHGQRLAALVADGDRDRVHLTEEASTLDDLVRALRAQRDPYAARTGALRRAYRSPVDDTLQPYSLYVPPSYRGDRPWPVIVALHGLGGTAHRMLPILFGVYDKDEDRTHADRHFAPLPDTRALLVAPYAFGDSFYRGVGEHDVLRVLSEVRAAYRSDVDRTYITGLSMGGIGAASIPLRHPDVFAAAAPLCGYHDYFVRTDTRGHRRPWELWLMESRSNRNWAENGLHLPMYVVQGTLDRPVTNSTTFVERYRELRYTIDFEYPELGHDVWSTTYAGGRIVPYFARFVRDPAPPRVLFRTTSTRWPKSYWVEIDAIAQRGAWAEVDASVSQNTVRVHTRNVEALTLRPPVRPPFQVTIDGQPGLRVDREGPLSLARRNGPWSLVEARTTQPPLGPIREAFDGPLLVVYGARSAGEAAMNRRIAEVWARVPSRARTSVRIIADDAYSPADARGRTVVLVGTPASHRVLERMQSSLPIRVEGGALRTHDRIIAGATGAVFVAPSPDAPDGKLVVVTGTSALGVWRSRFLPELVPDFVLFDDRIAPARDRVLLGRYASVLCAGFYDREGRVGPRCEDVPPPAQRSATDDDNAE